MKKVFLTIFKLWVWVMVSGLLNNCTSVSAEKDLSQTTAVEIDKPSHHTVEGFQNNPAIKSSRRTGVNFILRRIWYSIFPLEMKNDYIIDEAESLKQLKDKQGANTITWLGHASFLIRREGKAILTDPHLTNWAAPFPGVGPLRYSPPGISIENLPPIDMVVISHNHYDHLSRDTLKRLPNKSRIHIIVPLGMKPIFVDMGYTLINELDWHESISIDGIQFRALPSVHHSGRGLFDMNESLWASWLIRSNNENLYFAGDTAYSKELFEDIGHSYGPFEWAMLPIGAYLPRETMKNNHVNPQEAVQIGIDIKAKNLVAMHWGTFNLTDEPPEEPPKLFLAAGKELNYASDALWLMKIGETRYLTRPRALVSSQ